MATVTETAASHATNGVAVDASPVIAKLQAASLHAPSVVSDAPAVHDMTVSNIVVPAAKGAGDAADIPYTTFHLAACSFVHPDGRPSHIRQCCAPKPAAENGAARPREQHIRLYHSEPSHFGYNRGCDIIRESRFSTRQGWHAPAVDDLVADDVGAGSAIASVGWWVEQDVYETRVYYADKSGTLRERWNRTSFKPQVHDSFDIELPAPAKLVPPHPGWAETNLRPADTPPASTADTTFPEVKPLAGSKFAAVRSEDGTLHVYYQAADKSIHELANKGRGWTGTSAIVLTSDKAKPGSPLTAVSGGWNEMRLFFVTPNETLAGVYRDDHTRWTPIEMPAYKLLPSAMLSAVAWNYASAFFEIRIFTTDDKNDLYEYHFDRKQGGWAPAPVNINKAPAAALSPAKGTRMPLSAVAAVIVDDEWKTKVYFHPRRTIAEWDVCSKSTAFNGIPKVSAGAAARRQIEEETRAKIQAEEERKKKHDAEEAKKKQQGGPEAKKNPLPNKVTLSNPVAIIGSLTGHHPTIDDVFHKVDLPFPVTLYGHASKTLWVTENGFICLDRHTDARAHRQGQPLPSRNGIPPHALFPYWADLMIAAGKPHGVYYEVSGAAPNRHFTVEWYVTRYKHEEQYFHFNATLEEAQPDIVSFRYYDVGDGGHECTVGVQGPTAHLQYSHNQANIHRGLQITFNTHENKMHATQFRI
ncbi:hypothetical protein N657DRAFT_683209 [Parathielavia appendiculata]|uniref:Fucose-specific lectin n=1 Tax=Parathielavia appendiculata TaxID=2587402 RepID=A0AAN6TUR0_9PEZI|nr:hypothetical protein N657DRAFT_683209 [Parathielavia appendiculata]